MNDVVASTLQKARAEFARSTTTLARQTMMQVRQLDRVREIDSRFYVMFEVACLFRDNSTAEATKTLRGIAPLSDAEWAELQTILGSEKKTWRTSDKFCRSSQWRNARQLSACVDGKLHKLTRSL